MHKARSGAGDIPAPRFPRWAAPALLLVIAAGLAPLWWEVTSPPLLAIALPWRDAAGVLLVPADAVRAQGPQGRLAAPGPGNVFVIKNGVARLTRVRLGVLRDGAVEVHEGLEESAVVVANPPRGLEDRHRVAVRP